jgi:DNA processing protein
MDYQCLSDWHKKPELSHLLELPQPPKQLYYRGRWNSELFANCVAVIGSRRITQYGKRAVDVIIPQLVMSGKTIVSGFMYGTDQYAHQVCIDSGGKTIAVLGWGIARGLEDYDRSLAEHIVASGGLLLSEWEDQRPTLWTFPVRNRIVAALSDDVIVVEAAQKSGSLITATIAHKMNRTLWAVPGPITSGVSEGTNGLIASGKAKMWLGHAQTIPQEATTNPLVRLLTDEALTVNDIARKLEAPVDEIGAQLSLLTLTGELIEREGKYYVRQN